MEVEERRKIGLKYLKTIDGEVGDEVIKALDGVAGDIGNYILEFAFGEIYNRKSLNLKQREMVCTQVCNFVSTNRKEVANMKRIFIVGAKRTPIGKFGGSLSTFSASELGAKVISAVLKQSKLPKEKIDQILIGNVLQAGQGQNPARTASRLAGLPESIPAITINDVCGSGLSSVNLGASLIMSGQAEVVLVGGMESMSNAPYLLDKARVGYKMGDGILIDSMLKDSLIDSIGNYHMGMTAENISSKYSITRGEMDKYAVESHQKATYTTEYGGFKKEIVDIIVDNRKGRNLIVTDENIRSDTSIEKLATLKSAFKESGVVTAGNSSSINDGASILMLVSEKILYDYKLTPLAEWIDSSLVGLEPRLMGIGPEIAVKKLLTQQKMDITDIDIFELNEAFAAQSIACIRQLGINDMDKVNPKGGAIALGHPVGASGSRILTTLIYELIENKGNYGIASLCIGGGMGAATLIKNANSNL